MAKPVGIPEPKRFEENSCGAGVVLLRQEDCLENRYAPRYRAFFPPERLGIKIAFHSWFCGLKRN
ncbi:hypothetical protein PC128_g17005 [Phytophthora cactorum]|nr:hypothetical protein PC128_g17005 [Phytophthora cactorum]